MSSMHGHESILGVNPAVKEIVEKSPFSFKGTEFEVTSDELVISSPVNFEFSFGAHKSEIPPQARAKIEQQIQDIRNFLHETNEIFPQDSKIVQEVTRIGKKFDFLLKGKHVTHYIINSNQIDAFALGNEIYISTALINVLPDEDCIASVLAHEATHVGEEHLFVRYEEQTPETINEALKRASLPRVHEYEADTRATDALNQAGYDPTAFQTCLAILSELEKGTGFTHGSSKDRQSLQRTIMKFVDFEHSGSGRTKKSELLRNLPEEPNLLESLDKMYISDKDRFEEKLERMTSKTLLRYHTHLTQFFDQMYSDEVIKNQSPDANTMIRYTDLILATDREVDRRITKALPAISSQERVWLKIQLFTEVADRPFASLQLPSKFMRKHGYREQSHHLDYAGALNKTIMNPDDLISFTRFIQEQKFVKDLGYELVEREFPERVFWKYFNEPRWDQRDVFLHDLVIKFARGHYIFSYQENGKIDFSTAAKLVDQIGVILGSEYNEKARIWFGVWLERLKDLVEQSYIDSIQKKDSRLYNKDTPEALKRYAPEVLPCLFDLYIEFAQIKALRSSNPQKVLDDLINSAPGLITARVYGNLEYHERQQMVRIVKVDFLRTFYPESNDMLTSIDCKDEEALTKFLGKYGVKRFFELFEQFGLSGRDYPENHWVKITLDKYLESNLELTPENKTYLSMLVVASSGFLPLEFRNKIEEIAKKGGGFEFLVDELGLTKKDLQLLLKLEAISALEVGGNENVSYNDFVDLVNGINPTDYSENMQLLLLARVASLATRAGGVWTDYRERNLDLDWGVVLGSSILQSARNIYAENEIKHLNSAKEQLQAIQRLSYELMGVGKMYHRDPEFNLMGVNEHQATFLSPLIISVTESISNRAYSEDSMEDLREVHELIGFFDDRRSAARLRLQLELKMLKIMDFNQATNFIRELKENGSVNFEVVDYYQEHFVRTPEQLEQAQQVLDEVLESTTREGSKELAVVAGFDSFFEYFLTERSVDFLQAAVETRNNDTKLRKLLAEYWYEHYAGSSSRPYRVELPEIGSQKPIELAGGARHMFVPFENFVNMFYSRLSQTEIDLILRKVLISQEGVLMNTKGRRALHNLLMTEVLAEDENIELKELLSEIIRVGLDVIDPTQLYEPISALLRKNILVKPQTPGNNYEAAKILVEKRNQQVKELIEFYRPVQRFETLWEQRKNYREYLEAKANYEKHKTNIQQMIELLAFSPEVEPEKRGDLITRAVLSIEAAKARLNALVEYKERDSLKEKVSPLRAVKEMAQSMGSVGVRFLQLIGQYVEIPPEYEKEFSTVYDSMRGQIKYTAYKTLRREALREGATAELRNFWGSLQGLSETIGGGSLYTVYVAKMQDRSLKVVKVLVPNAISFIQENIESSQEVASRLLSTQKYKNSEEVILAKVLIDDLEDWLIEDVRAVDYEQDDREFSRLHNNISSESGVTVKVPHMTPTGTMYIKIEDYVPGKNLNALLEEDEEDTQLKEIVRGVGEDFYRQIETPTETGDRLVHSDVHKGNIRIAKENDGNIAIWWLDRGYYLRFDDREAKLVSSLMRGQFSMPDAIKIFEYLNSLPQNSGFNFTRYPMFLAEMARKVSDLKKREKTPIQTATALIVEMRRRGIYIPLKWSLLLKNVVNVNNMIKAVEEQTV